MVDNLTPEQRRYAMSRVRTKDTDIEMAIRSALHRRGLRFRKHVSKLAGKPDIVFPTAKVAVFIDGDFWHGYRFPAWRASVSPFWRDKIDKTRRRDRRNFTRLRRAGWAVIRVWQHEVHGNVGRTVDRIHSAVRTRSQKR